LEAVILTELTNNIFLEGILEKSIERSAVGFAVIDEDGLFVYVNPIFCAMFAIPSLNEAIGQSLLEHVASKFQSLSGLSQALECSDAANIELSWDRNDEILVLHLDIIIKGKRLLVAKQQTKSVTNSAFPVNILHRDPLTGLGNRLMLDEIIAGFKSKEKDASSLAVIMIDLQRFKQVNDTLGHEAGDTLLKLASKRIKSAVRSNDLVIRIGSDEFVVLHTSGLQPIGAESLSKRIVELISRPFLIESQQVNIGASVGIAVLNHGTDNTSDLLKHADLALYEAKATGRSSIKFFEPALAKRATERRQMEIDLRRALGLKEFKLMYQPQVNMATGSLQGFEALIRWHNPARGMVSPADFIPLAEETGEIHAIGEWTLLAACKEAMNWDGNFSVAVNVSPIQFENEKIVDIVKQTLESTGLPPERLELEITEGVLMKDQNKVQKILWAIKSIGVGIAMDDFGTGYSSLSYLNSFPFSKIKIDQSFVRLENTPKSRALIQAIISLGLSLNMKTIAEGVETEAQFNELAAGGCMEAQGYLISRPIPPQAISDFIVSIRHKII
jgi:diguanylate cyclase (GGDEF)-like protein